MTDCAVSFLSRTTFPAIPQQPGASDVPSPGSPRQTTSLALPTQGDKPIRTEPGGALPSTSPALPTPPKEIPPTFLAQANRDQPCDKPSPSGVGDSSGSAASIQPDDNPPHPEPSDGPASFVASRVTYQTAPTQATSRASPSPISPSDCPHRNPPSPATDRAETCLSRRHTPPSPPRAERLATPECCRTQRRVERPTHPTLSAPGDIPNSPRPFHARRQTGPTQTLAKRATYPSCADLPSPTTSRTVRVRPRRSTIHRGATRSCPRDKPAWTTPRHTKRQSTALLPAPDRVTCQTLPDPPQ